MPEQVRGPLPQLVRDMSAAMAKQQKEHEELQRRLSLLQPSVLNYNPKDVDQLTKAAKEVTDSSTGADVSGALPKLLKDLNTALESQKEGQAKLEKRLKAISTRKMRTTKRARTLKELILRTSPRVEDKVEILFGEANDRCAQAVEEARQGAEFEPSEGDGDENDNHKWQDSLQQLQDAVVEEFKAASERNATLTAKLLEEQAARKAVEEQLKALTTPPPPPPPLLADTPGGGGGGGGVEAAATTAAVPSTATDGSLAASSATAAGEAAAAAVEPPAAVALDANAGSAASPPPPSPPPAAATEAGAGACAGKRCPAGYDMIDRGDRCTCRPQPASAAPSL